MVGAAGRCFANSLSAMKRCSCEIAPVRMLCTYSFVTSRSRYGTAHLLPTCVHTPCHRYSEVSSILAWHGACSEGEGGRKREEKWKKRSQRHGPGWDAGVRVFACFQFPWIVCAAGRLPESGPGSQTGPGWLVLGDSVKFLAFTIPCASIRLALLRPSRFWIQKTKPRQREKKRMARNQASAV